MVGETGHISSICYIPINVKGDKYYKTRNRPISDHKIDLQASGALSDPNGIKNLGMLNCSVNGSVGKQLANEIERLGLQTDDEIDGIKVIGS